MQNPSLSPETGRTGGSDNGASLLPINGLSRSIFFSHIAMVRQVILTNIQAIHLNGTNTFFPLPLDCIPVNQMPSQRNYGRGNWQEK